MKEIHIGELDEKKAKELNDTICKRIAKGLDINYVQKQDRVIQELVKENYILHSIIKEVREYITSYESIKTIQQCEHSKNNKGLDKDTMIEMTNRYLKVHDKILEILDKENI